MPLNLDAVGTVTEPHRSSWTADDSLLYSLAVGAGWPDPLADLSFTTENSNGVTQQALPTFAVVLGGSGGAAWADVGTFNPVMLVHAEQAVELHAPLPVAAAIDAVTTLTDIADKGSGALVSTETVAADAETGEALFTTRSSAFIRGEGGFDPNRPSSPPPPDVFSGKPDESITYETLPNQALLYRLCGDRNPLHSDPTFAAMGGFDRPILHGLCTYGFTGRALLAACCNNDPTRFGSMSARFSKPVVPGDTLTVSIWESSDGAWFRTATQDGSIVIDRGRFTQGESK